MQNDITLNTIAFTKNYDNESEGKRSSIARGPGTPDVLFIKQQSVKDSYSGVTANRVTISTEQFEMTAEGKNFKVLAYAVFQIPELTTSAQLDRLVATFRAAIASTSPNIVLAAINGEK